MSAGKLAAGLLRNGHEIRVPGQEEWLAVEEAGQVDAGFLLRAGGREFLTTRLTPWPARVAS